MKTSHSNNQENPIGMIGASPAFLEHVRLLSKISASKASIVIFGETGSGKEMAARAIHHLGNNSNIPFVSMNCGTISEEKLANYLFDKPKNAALFLDEIEALSTKGQISLLRYLQDQQSPDHPQSETIRIIAATSADLLKLVEAGTFRPDLLFRLQTFSVEIPPLRERHGDAELLAKHFIKQYSAKYDKPSLSLHSDTLRYLSRHNWPGNIRELANFIHREFLIADGPTLRAGLPANQMNRRKGEDRRAGETYTGHDFNEAKAKAIENFEKSFLSRLLSGTHGNVTLAAKKAGKERRALGKLIKKHGIDKRKYADSPQQST